MRPLLLAASMAIAAILLPAAPAQAYGDAPWCLKFPVGAGVIAERCEYPNFETCRADRLSGGNSAFCIQNSWYLPYWNGAQNAPRKVARKKKRSQH